MKLKAREEEGIQIVSLHGDLTGGPESDALHKTIVDLIAEDKNDFILDLTTLEFMNSTGIGTIIRCYTTTMRSDGKLKAVAPQAERSWRILNIVQLSNIIEIYETVEEALASFGKEGGEE